MSTPHVPRQPATPPGQPAVPPQAAPEAPAVPPVVRRPAAGSPWAAQRPERTERTTSRLRRVVEGLPDWEPLPPGETLVRRPSSEL